MFEPRHVDLPAAKPNAFSLQQKTLLQGGFSPQRDPPSGAHNALPRQSPHLIEHSGNMAGATRISRGFRDRSVGADLPAGNVADRRGDGGGQLKLFHGEPQSTTSNRATVASDTATRAGEKIVLAASC